MKRDIKAIIHCSDSSQGRGTTAKDIHRWHQEEPRNWDGIGYHYVILEDGTIENGRPEYWVGSHAKGYNDTIGICLIGEDTFRHAQMIALEKLIKDKGWSNDEVVGHYQVNKNKTCPNFDVDKFLIAIEVN